MGKWCAFNPSRSKGHAPNSYRRTPSYVDDVLHAKISNMVYVFIFAEICDQKRNLFYSSGAIRRMAVEKEPSISYESFVNELDTGDSFTLSLVDILVKVRDYFYHFLAALIV